MEILDSTLREGEQQYGVFFPVEVKVKLAAELVNLADFVEIGSPLVAPSYAEAAAKLVKVVPPERLIVHCRLNEECIRTARDVGAKWVGLFVAIRSDLHHLRYGRSSQQTIEIITGLLRLCRKLGLHVRLTCEDASRTGIDELVEFYSAALASGADRIGFADTVGVLSPDQTHNYFVSVRQAGVPLSKLHAHFHNDRGFANENADVAVKLGVACIDGTVAGIGERVGITHTEYLTALLSNTSNTHLDKAKALVDSNVRFHPVSELRFAHKAGVHIDGVLKYPPTYEWTPPEQLRLRRFIILSKLSGRRAVRHYLACLTNGPRQLSPGPSEICQALKREDSLEIVSQDSFETFLSHAKL